MLSAIAAIPVLLVVLIVLAIPTAVVCGVAYVIFKLFQGLGLGLAFVLRHLFTFLKSTVLDTIGFAGALVTAVLVVPLALVNLLLGRWSAAGHYGRAIEDELTSSLLSLYRLAVANPLRLVGLHALSDGLGRRIPDLIVRAPRSRRAPSAGSRRERNRFEGYEVVGELPRGGSGAQLYVARPRRAKLAALRSAGRPAPARVVIKAFALGAGSTMPQIVRESRALEAANRLGLVLEHELTDKSFHYVMPYIPGDDLDTAIRKLHAEAGPAGLRQRDLERVLGYSADLLETLERFHSGGLWHKDVKPANLIVADDRVHLVDFGLVTPLQSAMTLTTHGTEFYRDPAMVRLAMEGVRVHDVDGVKFDLYSAGAVVYSMIENSFPEHGSLSRLTKRCPEALRWIVRRAMAEMQSRYGSAAEMLADVRAVLAARDPFAVLPADLPSMRGSAAAAAAPDDAAPNDAETWRYAAFRPTRAGAAAPSARTAGPAAASAPETASALPVSGGRRRARRRVLRAVAAGLLVVSLVPWAMRGAVHAHSSTASRAERRPWVAAVEMALHEVRRERDGALDIARDNAQDTARTGERNTPRRSGLSRRWSDELGATIPRRAAFGDSWPDAVLVLEGPSPSIDARIVDGLREELEHRGYEVLGCGADGPGDEREIALVAGARAAVGLSDPGDVEAAGRLDAFLATSEGLAAIVWLAPSGESGEAEGLTYRLLRRRDFAAEVPRTFAPTEGDT